ncbi:hypothetical protein BDW22DRAFT_410438 [Trametopsis cervina]|nr:hypothetical protein BDW22DRAFT_410438 [Trametopsis cervina]
MDNGTRNARPEVTEASVALAKANELKEQELQERIRQMQEQEHVQCNSRGRRQPGRGNADSEVDEAGVKVRSVYWRAADFGRPGLGLPLNRSRDTLAAGKGYRHYRWFRGWHPRSGEIRAHCLCR